MPEAILELSDGSGRRIVPVDKDCFTVGRQSDNDLQVDAVDVSRRHAEIVRREDGYLLRDLGSRYGTFVNDQPVAERELQHGDRIRLGLPGQAEMLFMLDAADRLDPAVTPMRASSLSPTDLRQVATLLEGLRALGSVRVLEDVLALVLDAAIEATGAERGFVMLSNPMGELEFKLARARGRVTLPGMSFQTSRKIPDQVFATMETQIVADLLEPGLAGRHPGTVKFGIRAALCAPLRLVHFTDRRDAPVEEPRCIGVLYLDSRNRAAILSPSTRTALESLATEAAVAIENARLYRESAEKAKLDQELRVAAEIQQSLLPPRNRTAGGIEVAGATLPCRAIGGDFFDYFDLPNGHLGFSLGDVAGKGPPAALLAALVQGILSSQAEDALSPAVTLDRLNRSLLRRSIGPRFATVAYAVLSPGGELTSCNAGHNPPLIVGSDGSVRQLTKGGFLLGLFEQAIFEQEALTLSPGDTLFIYSDGVTEAMNARGEQFGDERLIGCLARAPELSADGLLECVFHGVSEFAGEVPQFDDVTALVVKYGGR